MTAIELWDLGAVGIEELPGALRAAFSDAGAATDARDRLAPGAALEKFDDRFGLDASRDLLGVEIAGGFAIHPPWLDPPPGARPIAIDPALSFGSGSHPSTRLALQLLETEADGAPLVADLGCGSGVLSIGAALLGARVVAIDTDPEAIAATRANARRNRVADRIDTVAGSIEHIPHTTDLVVINVTIDIHEQLAPGLPAGPERLIVAGILGESQLARSAIAYGATVVRAIEHDDWMAAVLSRS